nr:unnamed protein product [Callosobruchus analis]
MIREIFFKAALAPPPARTLIRRTGGTIRRPPLLQWCIRFTWEGVAHTDRLTSEFALEFTDAKVSCLECVQSDQSIADYIVELRKLASSCRFGQFLDDALRDRFVCGIRSEQLQRQLLSDDKLSLTTACQKAQAAELAEKQVKDLASSTDNPINAVQRYPEKKYSKPASTKLNSGMCKNCRRTHGKDQCPTARWKCFACSKYGHVRIRCMQNLSVGAVQGENSVTVSSEESVSESVVVNEDLYSVQINNVSAIMPAHKVSLVVAGSHVDFEVDTGACKSLMSDGMYHKFLDNVNLCKVRYKLNTISGENIKVVGEGLVQVRCRNKEVKLPLIVVESRNEFTPLLGRNWLDILFPNWQHGFKLYPLYRLLEKDVEFDFSDKCKAFQLSKELIMNNQVVTDYDPSKTIVVSCDASAYCKEKWKVGEIVKCVSAITYLVKVDDQVMYKHVNVKICAMNNT